MRENAQCIVWDSKVIPDLILVFILTMDFEDVERSEAVFPQDGNRSNLERQTFLTNEPLPSKFGGLAAVIQAYPSTLIQREGDREKLLLVLVGLPARGKTYISRKLTRYLQWIGYNTSAFNVGSYRRKKYGTDLDFTFFDPNNAEGVEQRKVCAEAALSDCLEFLSSGGQIGILDGTNSTKERQDGVISQVEKFMVSCALLYFQVLQKLSIFLF